MNHSTLRWLSLPFLVAVGVVFIILGFHGWVIDNAMPAQYGGYIFIATAFLGLLGVNVWSGGPLDRKDDVPEWLERKEKERR